MQQVFGRLFFDSHCRWNMAKGFQGKDGGIDVQYEGINEEEKVDIISAPRRLPAMKSNLPGES